jgi:hypothetical protein
MSKRLLKELQSLAPWQWDSNILKNPAGPASLRDFEGVRGMQRLHLAEQQGVSSNI